MVVEDNGAPDAVGAEQRSAFVNQVSDGLGRADERGTARVYLRDLLDPPTPRGRCAPAARRFGCCFVPVTEAKVLDN
jgi:hypothetical protein